MSVVTRLAAAPPPPLVAPCRPKPVNNTAARDRNGSQSGDIAALTRQLKDLEAQVRVACGACARGRPVAASGMVAEQRWLGRDGDGGGRRS